MILSPLTSVGNVPKMSSTTLELKKNYYVIHDGTHFHYFPVKILAGSGEAPILRFEKYPPVLMEGVVIVGQGGRSSKCNVYKVPVHDLMRGVIRKSREIKPTNRVKADGSSGTTAIGSDDNVSFQQDDVTSRIVENAVHAANQSGALEAVEMEVHKAANVAWEEQIDTLLHHISSQEGSEWEIAGDPQSGRPDESRTVQDSQGSP